MKEQWSDQPQSYLGIFCPSFPNVSRIYIIISIHIERVGTPQLFMINGPLSCFVNFTEP